MMPVRRLTNRSRTRWSACKSSCSAVLVATNFIVGRCTASAIASASLCADAGLHADETGRQIGEPCFHLAARPLLAQDARTTPIETHGVKLGLADIDTDHGDSSIELV